MKITIKGRLNPLNRGKGFGGRWGNGTKRNNSETNAYRAKAGEEDPPDVVLSLLQKRSKKREEAVKKRKKGRGKRSTVEVGQRRVE